MPPLKKASWQWLNNQHNALMERGSWAAAQRMPCTTPVPGKQLQADACNQVPDLCGHLSSLCLSATIKQSLGTHPTPQAATLLAGACRYEPWTHCLTPQAMPMSACILPLGPCAAAIFCPADGSHMAHGCPSTISQRTMHPWQARRADSTF